MSQKRKRYTPAQIKTITAKYPLCNSEADFRYLAKELEISTLHKLHHLALYLNLTTLANAQVKDPKHAPLMGFRWLENGKKKAL